MSERAGEKKRIVVLGGGFAGAYAAQEFSRARGFDRDCDVTLIDQNNYLLFYPLLVEAGVGSLEPRHVVVPLRRFLPDGDFRLAQVLGIDTQGQLVKFQVFGSDHVDSIHYDHLLFTMGSVTKVPSIPGLREHGFQLKSLADAVQHRDRGIGLLELANTVKDEEARRALLTVIVVGANFTGMEFAGEYHAFLVEAAKSYRNVSASDIRVLVLEIADRILPGMNDELADWCHHTLTKRGLFIRTKTSVQQMDAHQATLTTGEQVRTETVLWAAGIAPNPIIKQIGTFPTNEKGYIECEQDLRVKGFENVWAAGDCATLYDPDGKPYAATAQNASRQGPHAARNILAAMRHEPTTGFDYEPIGSFAAIGRRQAAAVFRGTNIVGFPGWLLYRAAYLAKMPTFAMKLRLFLDWTADLLVPSEIVQLGVHKPTRALPPLEVPDLHAEADAAKVSATVR